MFRAIHQMSIYGLRLSLYRASGQEFEPYLTTWLGGFEVIYERCEIQRTPRSKVVKATPVSLLLSKKCNSASDPPPTLKSSNYPG